MTEAIIKTTGLAKEYFVGKNKIKALTKVDLEITAGDFVVIYGPSGSGKTTLLSLLAGLAQPRAKSSSTASTSMDLIVIPKPNFAVLRLVWFFSSLI